MGGVGTEVPGLGSTFCHELSEVLLKSPPEPPFAKEGRGRGVMGTGAGQEEGVERRV